jgi:hypothetical protein
MTTTSEPQKYRLSFTTGVLFLSGAPIAAKLYLQLNDWVEVRNELGSNNFLQARTSGTAARWGSELVQRLETLTKDEVALILEATADELAQLMWVATCRRFTFIGDFAEEVLRERFLLVKSELTYKHFDDFVSSKVLWHEELSEIKASTYQRLRSNLFQMLREGGLLTADGTIIPVVLASRVRERLEQRMPSDVRFFPTRQAA